MQRLIIIALLLSIQMSFAQENLTSQTTAEVEKSETKFKIKTEIKNSTNAWADGSQVNNFRLRLDPEVTFGRGVFALRQDVKGKYSEKEDITFLDDTRLMAGRSYSVGKVKLQPNFEVWLPTNLELRDRTNHQVDPGLSLKAKTEYGRVKVSYELNGRQMNYGADVKTGEASYKVFNELKNSIRMSDRSALNLDFKYNDDWDQKGRRSQKYEMQQGISYQFDENWNVQLGHMISKKNLNSDKSTKSVVMYDAGFSEFFTQLTHVY